MLAYTYRYRLICKYEGSVSMSVQQRGGVVRGFPGRLLVPGDAGYETGRAIWNAMHDRRPALIAYCGSPQDVIALDALLAQASQVGSPLSQVEVLSVGGAIAAVDAAATAFPHRDARWLLNIPAMWESADDSEAEIAWARATFAAIEPHLSGGAYVNFMDGDDEGAGTGAHATTLARLQAVKASYDPENVFRPNQNITPVAGAWE
jgi:FAD/FMN-containing dehydrogenase